ncbi:MAG: RNA 2',3'-cyclic phosphodiesterase [Candidatus Eisenbacteria bacterium]
MSVRAFVALELSEPAKAGILCVIDELRGRGVRASWSRVSTIHLTLRFLGDVEESELPDVVDAVRAAARTVPPFTMRTKGLGAFPSPRRPRVFWAGIEGPDELYGLRDAIEDGVVQLGFERERRRFHPHVTLGRLRDSTPDAGELLTGLSVPVEATDVTAVRVMRSTLAPSGARHDVVEELPLGGPS